MVEAAGIEPFALLLEGIVGFWNFVLNVRLFAAPGVRIGYAFSGLLVGVGGK